MGNNFFTSTTRIFKSTVSNSIRGRMVINISWSLIGSVFSRILVMLAYIFIGRVLGSDKLGELSIVQNTISVFCVIASSGISQGITKYIAEIRLFTPQNVFSYIKIGKKIGLVLSLSGVIILVTLSPYLSRSLSSNTNISIDLVLFSSTIIFTSINNIQIAILSGLEKFEKIALINGMRGIFVLIFGVSGSLILSSEGTILGLELAEFLTMIFSANLINKFMKSTYKEFKQQNEKDTLHNLLHFGVPSMVGSVITMTAFWYCNMLLISYRGYGEMGLYNAADKWKQILIFIPTAVSPTILPILSSLCHDLYEFKKVFKMNIFINLAIIAVPTILLIAFSRFAMGLYGPEFLKGNIILIILVISSIFSVVNNVIGQCLISLGAINLRTGIDIVLSIIVVGIALVLIPEYGAIGLAISYSISYSITALLVYFFNEHELKIQGVL